MTFDIGIEVSKSIKGLVFDLDGTLVDNMHLHVQAWVESGTHFGLPITSQMIIDNAGIPTLQLIEKLSLENNWEVDYKTYTLNKQARYRAIKKADGKINRIEPIIAIAEYYKDLIPMAIGTGSSKLNAIGALEDAGILSWFKAVITADDVINPKPHAEVFLKGAEIMGIDPTKCLVFEDGDKGIESAIAAKMAYVDVRKYL